MFPAKYVRDRLPAFQRACQLKRHPVDWERFEQLDNARRRLLACAEEKRRIQNDLSSKIAQLGSERAADHPLVTQAREISDTLRRLDAELRETEAALDRILALIPNPPHQSVPEGGASANIVVRTWGEPPVADFPLRTHWEIGEHRGLLDFGRGAKVSGSFFPVFMDNGARLVRALMAYMLDIHESAGFREVWVPAIVNRQSMFGTGQLPKLEDDMYHLERDDLFLIPTAEVPVTNLFRDEQLRVGDLPVRLTAYSPCFRREAGAYGRETRGLVRVHQFDKVEMVSLAAPDSSYEELELLVRQAEKVLQGLGLHYRVVLLASGELSFAASKCYDIEVWAPGMKRWLEVSSCSNFEDFQARRAGIRYRTPSGKTGFVHTLNGSGIAFPRTIAALLERYQRKDGSVSVPEPLRPYLGGRDTL